MIFFFFVDVVNMCVKYDFSIFGSAMNENGTFKVKIVGYVVVKVGVCEVDI